MSRRINSELLLLGSLPAASTEEALRAGGELFGDLVFALPDGETGMRVLWAAYEAARLLVPNPGLEVIQDNLRNPPRSVRETAILKVREGVTELRFESWPRIDDAIESYGVFRSLREQGVIPADVRFQVSLPFGTSSLSVFKKDWAHDFPIALRAYEDLFAREIKRLTAAIPADDLAIQWDVCWEVLDIEGVLVVDRRRRLGALRRAGQAHHPADTGGDAGRLPPLLRNVPVLADVRGARHGTARADGQLRDGSLRAPGRLAAPRRPRDLRSDDEPLLRAAARPARVGHPRVPRDCPAGRRARRAPLSVTRRHPGISTTSASRCTAASAASRGKTAWRRCASTATPSKACSGPPPQRALSPSSRYASSRTMVAAAWRSLIPTAAASVLRSRYTTAIAAAGWAGARSGTATDDRPLITSS